MYLPYFLWSHIAVRPSSEGRGVPLACRLKAMAFTCHRVASARGAATVRSEVVSHE